MFVPTSEAHLSDVGRIFRCGPHAPGLKTRPTYATVAFVGRIFRCGPWSFYIFSGRSTAGERAICECDIEFLQQLRMFDHLFPQQGDEIEARRSMRMSSPLGQGCIGGPPLGAKREQGCQQQGTICGDREDRLLGDRDRVVKLGGVPNVFFTSSNTTNEYPWSPT